MNTLQLARSAEALLDDLPAPHKDRAAFDLGLSKLKALFAGVGGALTAKGDLTEVRALGARATSTCGPVGAVRNWIVQVRRKTGVAA